MNEDVDASRTRLRALIEEALAAADAADALVAGCHLSAALDALNGHTWSSTALSTLLSDEPKDTPSYGDQGDDIG